MKKIFPVIIVLVYVMSCHKAVQNIYTPVDTLLTKHYNFREGTYWIYRDSATGVEDSLVVIQNRVYLEPENTNHENNRFYDVVQQNIKLYNNGIMSDSTDYGLRLEANTLFFGSATLIDLYNNRVPTYDESYFYIYMDSTEIIPSFTVLGKTYNNARIYHGALMRPLQYYMKDDVGFLLFRSALGTKELLRYKVIL